MLPSGIKLIYFCRIIKQNMTVMDLYADDLTDYIYQENDVDKKRALLLEVEAGIKKLMGEQERVVLI